MTQAQGPFAQLPYSLWAYPGLSIYERWLAATIIRLCWRPGPQPFSYQRLAKEAGLTPGALCTKGKDTETREGMIPHLEREGLVKVYRPVNEEGQVIRGKAFLIEPTEKLWQMNTSVSQSVYPVNTLQKDGTVYDVNASIYTVNTPLSPVNTPVYDVNTEEGINPSQECIEATPYIGIDSLDKKIDSFVALSCDGEVSSLQEKSSSNGKAPLDLSASTKEEVRPEELPRVVPPTLKTLQNGHTETTPTQIALLPAVLLSSEDAVKTPSPDKTVEEGKNKKRATMKECSPEEQVRRRTWQEYFNTRRGGELLRGKGERIDESNCIADLCRDFSDGQISLIDRFVLAEIFPYKLPVNRHKAGGHVIWKESQNAREVLKDRQKWPSSDAPAGTMTPAANGRGKPDKYDLHFIKLSQVSNAAFRMSQGEAMPELTGEHFTEVDRVDYRRRVLEMVASRTMVQVAL